MNHDKVRQVLKDLRGGTLSPEDEELIDGLVEQESTKILDAVTTNNVEAQVLLVKEQQRLRRVRERLLQRRQLLRQQTTDLAASDTPAGTSPAAPPAPASAPEAPTPSSAPPPVTRPASDGSHRTPLQKELLRRREARRLASPARPEALSPGTAPGDASPAPATPPAPTPEPCGSAIPAPVPAGGSMADGPSPGINSGGPEEDTTRRSPLRDELERRRDKLKRRLEFSPAASPPLSPHPTPPGSLVGPPAAIAPSAPPAEGPSPEGLPPPPPPPPPESPAAPPQEDSAPTRGSSIPEPRPAAADLVSVAPSPPAEPTGVAEGGNSSGGPATVPVSPRSIADPATSKAQRSLLRACARNDAARVQQLLAEEGVAVGADGFRGLWLAAEKGHDAVVQLLLEAQADPNVRSQDGATALYIASQNGHLAAVQRLLAGGAGVDEAKGSGATPLLIAAQHGQADIVRLLCGGKADVQRAMANGTTPLLSACIAGQATIVEYLVAQGADVRQTLMGKNAVLWALEASHEDTSLLVLRAALAQRRLRSAWRAWRRYTRHAKGRPPAAAPPPLRIRPADEEPSEAMLRWIGKVRRCDTRPQAAGVVDLLVEAVAVGFVEVGPAPAEGPLERYAREEAKRAADFARDQQQWHAAALTFPERAGAQQRGASAVHKQIHQDWQRLKQQLNRTEGALRDTLHVLADGWMYAASARAAHLSPAACAARERRWAAERAPTAPDRWAAAANGHRKA